MKNIIKTLKAREYAFIVISLFAIVTQVNLDLLIPDYMAEVTQLVQTPGSEMSDILLNGGLMLLFSLLSLGLTLVVAYFAAQLAATVSMRLREMVYNKTMSFSMGEMNKFKTSSLITRSTNDITQIQMFVAITYNAAIRAPLIAILAITKISGKNMGFTIATIVAVVSLLIVMSVVLSLSIPKSKLLQKLTDKLNLVTREQLTGVRVIAAYNAQGYYTEKFEGANTDVAYTNTFVNRTTAFIFPYLTFMMSTLTIVIYWIGVILINDAVGMDKLTIFSDMVVFTSYAMQIIMAFMMLTFTLIMLPRAVVSVNRISEVLSSENEIVDGKDNFTSTNTDTAISFKNVSFSYPGAEEAVLEGLTFDVKKGETVAIIGSTGSGKSTLINLIPRFYDATSGDIVIDGVNIRDYKQSTLRDKLGLVTQKAMLFFGSIGSNTALGVSDLSESEAKQALKIAQASDFVDNVGLSGAVAQGGTNLSGGQRQRVSIARAIYKQPEIYIFDDCFSALDYKTDKTLRRELEETTKGATKIIVAQRISTIKDADKIIVLDDGKIAGLASHTELLKSCPVYIEIAQSQLSKEELGL